MSGACGLSALYSYSSLNNPRMAAIKVRHHGRTKQPSRPALLGCPAAACVRVGVLLMHLLVFPGGCALQAGLGLTYLFAGRQLVTGNPCLGYDLGTVSSLALVSGQLHSVHVPVQKGGGGQGAVWQLEAVQPVHTVHQAWVGLRP